MERPTNPEDAAEASFSLYESVRGAMSGTRRLLGLLSSRRAGVSLKFVVCLTTAWVMYRLVDSEVGASAYFIAYTPFAFAQRLGIFLVCSIIFWHSALYEVVFSAALKWRALFLRSVDYVWYGAACIAAVLAINEAQVQQLLERKTFAEAELEASRLHAQQADHTRLYAACDVLNSQLTAEEERWHRITNGDIGNLCARPSSHRRNLLGFLEACDRRHLQNYSNDALFWPGQTRAEISRALNELVAICTAHDHVRNLEDRVRRDASIIRKSGWLPGQNSNSWLYVLALIIGFRLTRTTAELLDEYRKMRGRFLR